MQRTFQGILSNVTRSVLDSALNAATNTANRALDRFSVQEVTGTANVNEVAEYPVLQRAGSLLFHGPVPAGRFTTRPSFHLILHTPNSTRMFSLLRTDNKSEAEDTFILYKECIPLLVECDPSICDITKLDMITKKLRENTGWTAPHVAAALGLLQCLKHEKLVTTLNSQEGEMLKTPLLVAIEQGNIASVSTLLDLGVDVTVKDLKDNTVFHAAAVSKSPQIFQMLINKLPMIHHELLNHLNAEGFTPLHSACSHNNHEFVKVLLNAGARANVRSPRHGYPIHCAVKAQSVSCLQELVATHPTYLQSKDLQDASSPLHYASGPETLIPLLDHGCDPNSADEGGLSPLHHSVRRGCLKSTLYLLCHGAYLDMKGGEDDETPLHIASKLCNKILVQTLIVFGADINVGNKNGDTPRHLVCTSLRSDKDDVLFFLSAVGAERCSSLKQRCVDGCRYAGSFDGNSPPNFSRSGSVNLMHEALSAFALQISAREKSQEPMEVASGSTTMSDRPAERMDCNVGGRLLSLDGGGIRGLVLAQMLFVIEQEMQMPVIELFDWVAGTSTGGIVALALACGKSPLETQRIYMRLKDKVFVGERPYSASVMEDFLKKEFGIDRTMGSLRQPKIMIMTALVDRRPIDLHIFRNYKSPSALIGEPEAFDQEHSTQYVWEAAKVTGAAPSYFRLEHDTFIDGGLISNNPTLDALTELQQYFTAMKSLGYLRGSNKLPTVVVSLGTGRPPKTTSNSSLLDITWPSGVFDAITKVPRLASLVNLLIDQATQSEGQVVERGRSWCSAIGVPFFRFSPQMSEDIDLDEKSDEKLIHLLWETRCYMIANRHVIADMKRTLLEQSPPHTINGFRAP